MRIPEGRYQTVAEYARANDITVQAVYKAINTGRIKSYRIDNTFLIPEDSLIEDRRIKHGKYIGVSRFRKDLDVEALAKKRGIVT